jgi:hypothetical protein
MNYILYKSKIDGGKKNKNKRLILLIFALFFVIYIASSNGVFDPWDGMETFLVTEGMILHHSPKLYPDSPSVKELHFDLPKSSHFLEGLKLTYHTNNISQLMDQPAYMSRSLLSSAIAVPFYYAAVLFSVSPITVVSLLVEPIMLALTAVVIFCFSLEIYGSKKISFILTIIFGVCSFAWTYNGSFLPQPLQGLCLIASAFFIYISTKTKIKAKTKTIPTDNNNDNENTIPINNNNNNNNTNKENSTNTNTNTNTGNRAIYLAGLAGLFLGLSLFANPSGIVLIPGFIIYSFFIMRRNRRMKNLLSFLIMLTLTVSFFGLTNYWRFGSFTETGYGKMSTTSAHNGWQGLAGLSLSPGYGLIFYFPPVILLPIALKRLYPENKLLVFLSIYVLVATWLFFGTVNFTFDPFQNIVGWLGGGGWGPRYFVPVLPFITLVLGAVLTGVKTGLFMKISMTTLCVIGFYVSLLGILVWYQYGYGYGWQREALWKYDQSYDQTKLSSYAAMVWIPGYSPIILHTKALLSNFVSSDIRPNQSFWNDWGRLGLAPCSYNIYVFCKFGITPILLLSGLITAIAIPIILELNKGSPSLRYYKIISLS